VRTDNYTDVIRRLARRVDVEASTPLAVDERRLVAAVEQALRARARRRVLTRRATALTFAAAAALALVVGGRAWRGAAVPSVASWAIDAHALKVLASDDAPAAATVEGTRAPVKLERGMPVGAGLTLRAPAGGEVRLGTTDGTSLALEAGGELTVTETGATQRFALKRGAVSARVSRLFAGERFIVDTGDAEIEVHGTAFRVAVVPGVGSCGDGSTTRVSVVEGVVRVRAGGREVSVPAGGNWPAGCDLAAEATEATTKRTRGQRTRVHVARAEASAHEPPPPAPAEAPPAPAEAPPPIVALPAPARPVPAPAPSSLAAENDLFAAAVRAKKQGHLDEAARLFGDLATSHPGSPLVESALVQRMKILSTIDTAAGARAAAVYLELFPRGFARPEATTIADRRAP
jgi:hypothetical protein